MITKTAASAYATKPNIQYPGPATEVTGTAQLGAAGVNAAAATSVNEAQYGGLTAPALGGSAAIGVQTAPTVDSGDLTAVANGETTRYNQRTDY